MKKTLLSVLAGIAVIGSASAVPSPEDLKKLCEKNPDKYVWVEKDQFCAPINPCLSDRADITRAYCKTEFKDIRLRSVDAANILIDRNSRGTYFLNNFLQKKVDPLGKKYLVTTDKLGVIGYGDDYRVWEFQEIGSNDDGLSRDAFKAACRIYGGYVDLASRCQGYYPNNACSDIRDLASLVFNGLINVVPVTTEREEYTGDYYPHIVVEEVACEYKQ